MRGLLIKNTAEKVSVSAYNYYGANFKLNVFNQENNSYILENLQMVEGIEPVNNFTTTITESREIGQEVITVASASGLSAADRISVGNYIYRVTTVNENNITLHTGLKSALSVSDSVSKVGNMGVYSLSLSVPAIGTFLVQAKDSVYGIQHSDSITVQDKSIKELISEVTNNIDEFEATFTNKQGYKVMI